MNEPRGASDARDAGTLGEAERPAADPLEGAGERNGLRGDERSDGRVEAREIRDSRPTRAVDTGAMESLLHDVPLEVSVELGRVRLSLGELAGRLAPGAVIALDKSAGALLDVRVQSRLIARAEAVAIGERCGIRILELVGGGHDS